MKRSIPILALGLLLASCTVGITNVETFTVVPSVTPVPVPAASDVPQPSPTPSPAPPSTLQPTQIAVPTSDSVPGLKKVVDIEGEESMAVFAQGNYAYVSGVRPQELVVFDISDPANLAQVGSMALTGPANAIYVAGGYAYITAEGLQVVDVSDPTWPVEVGFVGTQGMARGVTFVGGYAYVADFQSLLVIDVSNPAVPSILGEYPATHKSNAYNVVTVDNYAYVAGGGDFKVVDISNPAAPIEVGSVDISVGGAIDVVAADGYVYALGYSPADNLAGLRVLDISDPAIPIPTGLYFTPGSQGPRALAVAGNYVYVADGDAGLRVVDVSDPNNPIEIAHYETLGFAYDVAVAGDYVFVAAGNALSILHHVKPGA